MPQNATKKPELIDNQHYSSMNTSQYAEMSSSDGSDTDSYDTLDPYYTKGNKKRRLNLIYPAIVTSQPSQF